MSDLPAGMSQADYDTVLACAALADTAGAKGLEFGYLHENVSVEDAGWWACVKYLGAKLMVENQSSPVRAARVLAERILTGATCKCGQPVTLHDFQPGCRWKLVGPRWEPGCDAPSIPVKAGRRGDLEALHRALAERRSAEPEE